MLNMSAHQAPDGQPCRVVTLRNARGMTVTLMDWGATLLSCRVPMADGSVRETLLGCDTLADYLAQDAFLGASVGRYANRIANSQYHYAGQTVKLVPNQGAHQLHGGPQGFNQRRWTITAHDDNAATLQLDSPDGDQGFPGHLQAEVTFTLDNDNQLSATYKATVDKPCPVNLTNHAYFNLDGVQGDIRDHRLAINADTYLPVSREGIPESRGLTPVADTSFDFRRAKLIRQAFLTDSDQQKTNGYDHAFLLNAPGSLAQPAAELWSSDGKLQLRLSTTAPALQFYSGNFLDGVPARGAGIYRNWQGIALESELLPDSPNHPEWPQPDVVLQPGKRYENTTVWHFVCSPA